MPRIASDRDRSPRSGRRAGSRRWLNSARGPRRRLFATRRGGSGGLEVYYRPRRGRSAGCRVVACVSACPTDGWITRRPGTIRLACPLWSRGRRTALSRGSARDQSTTDRSGCCEAPSPLLRPLAEPTGGRRRRAARFSASTKTRRHGRVDVILGWEPRPYAMRVTRSGAGTGAPASASRACTNLASGPDRKSITRQR